MKGGEVLKAGFPIWQKINGEIEASIGDGLGEKLLEGLVTVTVSNA